MLSQFFPFCPLHLHFHSQPTHRCPCPWVLHICSRGHLKTEDGLDGNKYLKKKKICCGRGRIPSQTAGAGPAPACWGFAIDSAAQAALPVSLSHFTPLGATQGWCLFVCLFNSGLRNDTKLFCSLPSLHLLPNFQSLLPPPVLPGLPPTPPHPCLAPCPSRLTADLFCFLLCFLTVLIVFIGRFLEPDVLSSQQL